MQPMKVYAISTTLALLVSAGSAVTQQSHKPKFEEIDVERINIVEKDGSLRMVISNRARQHPGSVDGHLMTRPHGRPPGILFFNHRGDECGGLIFDKNGENSHFVSLTMDKFRNDQSIGIQHLESDDGSYFAGMRVWDRPNTSLADLDRRMQEIDKLEDEAARKAAYDELRGQGEFGASRILIGKSRDKSATISLHDTNGNPRIRFTVGADGDPRLEFLDDTGGVIQRFPDQP